MSSAVELAQEQSVRRTSTRLHLFLALTLGLILSYGCVKSPVVGIIGALTALLVALCLALGVKNFLLLLILIRINMDLFHGQLSMSLTSFKTTSLPGALGIVVLCIGALYLAAKKVAFWRYPLVKPLGLFFVACLLSLPFSRNLTQSMTEMAELASFAVLYILIVDTSRSERDIKRIVQVLILSSLVPVGIALPQICSNFTPSLLSLDPSFRVKSTLTHPNAYAFYLVIVTTLSLSLFLHAKWGAGKFALLFLNCLLLVSLVFTYTRSAWIGMIVATVLMGMLKSRKLLFLGPVAIYGILLVFPFIFQRLDPIFNPHLFMYTSLAWRIELWSASIPYFLSHPLFGNGFGIYQLIGYRIDDWFAAAHNDYLRLLVETGIVGFSAYIVLLLALARLGIRARRVATDGYFGHIATGFVCLLAAYVLMSFTDNLFNHGGVQWYFWAYAGVIAAILRQRGEGREGVQV